jgi:succinyl-diaminopimelate desuccinylase
VVPAKASQFKPTINGNRIYGRGANDMKAAAAVEILLFKNLAKSLPYPIALQLVTDEEIGGFAGTKHQIQKGVKADFVIAGEPTNLGINSQAKGIINLEISARGKTAHGAYPWQGQNALTAVTNAVYTITKAHPTPKKEVWQTTYNLSWIKTDNITTNKVPDTATASFDIRYTPQDTGKIIPQLKTLLKNHPVKLSFLLHEPAQFTDVKNSFLVKLRQSVKNTTGKLAPIIVKHGGSDIRHFTTKNMAGVTFGPKGAGLHTDNEWVDINSLVQYYAILENFIKTL